MKDLFVLRAPLVIILWSLATLLRADDETTPKRIVTAPSGKFYILRYTEVFEPGPHSRQRLAIVPVDDPDKRIPLSIGDSAEPNTEVGLAFISPDENWIFSSDTLCKARLYHRAGELQYEPTCLVDAAWQFLSQQEKIDRKSIGMPRRLLLALSASVGPMVEGSGGTFKNGIGWWLCYFNTGTGKFELTDRLRAANRDARKRWDGYSGPGGTTVAMPLSAELIGKEDSWKPVKQHFETADKRLNDIYAALLAKLQPPSRDKLKQEQREWLIQRDTEAAIYCNQRWGPFSDAALIEGKATSTEARTTDLEKQLNP
jgi:uncharacterized protein YecT (DUF1311 family)